MQLTVATQAEDRPSRAVPGWCPDELGLGRAAFMASAMVTLLGAGLAMLAASFVVPPRSQPVIVRLIEPSASAAPPTAMPMEAGQPESTTAAPPTSTAETTPPSAEPSGPAIQAPPEASLLELSSSAPTPPIPAPVDVAPAPAPPTPAPVPDPAPGLAPETMPEPTLPLAVPSQVVLPVRRATQPAPSRRTPSRLAPSRPAARPQPAEPVQRPLASESEPARPAAVLQPAPIRATPHPNPQAAPADTTSGLGPYRSALHRQIERNILDDRAVQRLGVSGTAVIEASIAADGRVLSARIARSSGNRAIDQAALAAVQHGGFAAFGAHMPAAPITISVPIGVEVE